eukprot:600997-Rhodomonas_salina.2
MSGAVQTARIPAPVVPTWIGSEYTADRTVGPSRLEAAHVQCGVAPGVEHRILIANGSTNGPIRRIVSTGRRIAHTPYSTRIGKQQS